MRYDDLEKAVESLSYRAKFRLAELLIELGRKEEEAQHPERRVSPGANSSLELTTYVADRIKKLRPTKNEGLVNSINAMFQFQGGISDQDRDKVIFELQKIKLIAIGKDGRVSYPE
jgi:hypothetical protein